MSTSGNILGSSTGTTRYIKESTILGLAPRAPTRPIQLIKVFCAAKLPVPIPVPIPVSISVPIFYIPRSSLEPKAALAT